MSSKDHHRTLKKAKSSIFDLFSRPKVERARGVQDIAPTDQPIRQTSTLKEHTSAVHDNAQNTRNQRQPSLKHSRSVRSFRSSMRPDSRPQRHEDAPFEPPPLFQAYPQAIRHTILEAPGSSHGPNVQDAETEMGDDIAQVDDRKLSSTQTVFERLKARRKSRHAQAQQDSHNVSTESWTQKIYMLVTTGHLLQYSGHGPFDRLPEKTLKLSKDSAAFASDAIEGKHWVLQIVQEAREDHLGPTVPKTFLAKVGLHGNKRMVSTMLLVFNTPEAMDAWMTTIRREVETLGGTIPSKVISEHKDEPQEDATHEHDAALRRRLSGIVRHNSVRSPAPLSPLSPVTQTSTVVASPRLSSATTVASPTTSLGRSMKGPPSSLLLPVHESDSAYTDEGYGPVIGPALSSPSFFEQRPSPMRFDFPPSSGALSPASNGSGSRKDSGGRGVLHPVPDVPHHYTKSSADASPGSQYSRKETTPILEVVPEMRRPDRSPEKWRQHHSPMKTITPHLSTHEPSSSEITDSDTSFDSTDRPVSISMWPAPPLKVADINQQPALTRSSSMEPISESPPATPGLPIPARSHRRPAPLKLNGNSSTSVATSIYTRRSSLAPPGEAIVRTNSSKRNSVFHKPLPLRVSPPQSNRVSVQHGPTQPLLNRTSLYSRSTPPQSNRASIQQRPTPPQSNRVSVHRGMSSYTSATSSSATSTAQTWSPCTSPTATNFTPPSTAGLTPLATAALDTPAEEKHFYRPPSISSYQALIASHPLSARNDVTQSPYAPDTREKRISTQVPIIRPPIRSSILRSRPGNSTIRQSINLPPPLNPPPNGPLPATPSPASPPPALPIARAIAV